MRVEDFAALLEADFYTGVPDSQLRGLCDYLIDQYGSAGAHHQIGANEGNCTAMAAGYHLATGKVPVVYLQNSGLGNIINPLASLLHTDVYGIPCIFVIGWRGEPGMSDEPQHVFQGRVTLALLQAIEVPYYILDADTSVQDAKKAMENFRSFLKQGRQVAFVVRKGALQYPKKCYQNESMLSREAVIQKILEVSAGDRIICTTGKASRELFELREQQKESHANDFLTVGSMGHASSIALELARQCPKQRFWCLDGDGAALMHLGAMAAIGISALPNLIHVVINNRAHESVGGQPTVGNGIDFCAVARGCGYPRVYRASCEDDLMKKLKDIYSRQEIAFLEVMTAIGARENLGRPTISADENKAAFMQNLQKMW